MAGDDKDHRREKLFAWASRQIIEQNFSSDSFSSDSFSSGMDLDFTIASDDASFRRYFRVVTGGKSFILMDAPPELENSQPFVEVGRLLFDWGVNVPQIFAVDLDQGFMLLSDFGADDYLNALNIDSLAMDSLNIDARNSDGNSNDGTGLDGAIDQSRDKLYDQALTALIKIQKIPVETELPLYDRKLLAQEMNLFTEWFLPRLLELELSVTDAQLLEKTFNLLVVNAEIQPQVLVHRDYHSRNLMVLSQNSMVTQLGADRASAASVAISPGILDFQDAVIGPVTYDLVSLLRDCYISWPNDYVYDLVANYKARLVTEGLLNPEINDTTFERWFDLMGLQRHIKVAGIFSRLKFRDGKDRYLQDIPLVVSYIRLVAAKYDELGEFCQWFEEVVVEAMKIKGMEII